ncbi:MULTISPECIES: hypothetical protein [Marivita]|uniref:Uncharacterized protein n=1 Tax=Marivita cryptomonadis TaxID=505252 RepID=A0A9Q2RWW6_9RHOB|nr:MULTISPECIES: hypothetical protein [Marivita]MCR9166642.1 hypothetical protein [Paracoccaceae bacterium]MBM2321316.1 hypothetical protein [Marivita cryptomonadis]MBM2330897.1 hypothetical protein [Marivita cryptomonadis]MBM2340483.1 hypothetical protein [Marivita cryptomonadis]MBM2345145.1 hypothetical protein [Marivita cryptomonadis]
MTQKPSSGKSTPQAREDRLKAALKANMAKRKAQARARSAGAADEAKNNKNSSEGS